MTESQDMQKKPIIDFRKLLQERLDKTNPRRQLAKDDTTKLAKLEGIAEKLKRGKNVQNRQLKTWLSQDEYAQVDIEWQEQLEIREELKDKPDDFQRYEEKLKQATFYYNRAEGYSSKGKYTTAKTFYSKSESLCEDALEILQDILHYDGYLRIWFDRDINFEAGSDLSADIVSLPRLITSRSNENLRDDSRITNKLSVKLSVVERAIDAVGRD
jgi:tetratricopeptide (TPR) repeat protein